MSQPEYTTGHAAFTPHAETPKPLRAAGNLLICDDATRPSAGDAAFRREMAMQTEIGFLRGVLEGLKSWPLPDGAREKIDGALARKF